MMASVSGAQRVLYLHVGAPKSGTSFLQSVFWASRRQLREQGLTLPMQRVEDHARVALDVRERYDEGKYLPNVRGGLDRFASSLEQVDTPRALFSTEVIVGATPAQIERFYGPLAGFDIHIIITARDLARQIPSAWQQSLKRRSGKSYAHYLGKVLDDPALTHAFWRSQDVAGVARRWVRSLPAGRIHIVTVPPPGAPESLLLERFCSVIEVDPDRIDTEAARSNPSLGAPQAELMRRVNRALGNRLEDRRGGRAGYNRVAKRYFAKEVLAAQTGQPLTLPPRYAARTRELSERMAQEIRDSGYDVVGDLADLEPAVFGESSEFEQVDLDASDATVAAAAVQALATMLEQRHKDVELISELRKQLRGRPAAG